MKKFILLFSLIWVLPNVASAYVDNQYMVTAPYLVNTGYSAEMEKMINIVADDPYRQPAIEGKSKKDILRRVYHYLVPGEEADLDFYNHSTNFNNTNWKDY